MENGADIPNDLYARVHRLHDPTSEREYMAVSSSKKCYYLGGIGCIAAHERCVDICHFHRQL